MAVEVTRLALAAVKATRLREVEEIELDANGPRGNRVFFLVDDRGRMVNAKTLGELNTIVADYSEAEQRLALQFPGRGPVEAEVKLGEALDARFYSGMLHGRLVQGPWSRAVSDHVGKSLRLVFAPGAGAAIDRGAGGTVSLISRASLARLAHAAGQDDIDARRFRMLIEIDGVPAHAEDAWVGRTARTGDATVRFGGHVGRCLITSRDPETGTIDLPTLDVLRGYRSDASTTEPLPFGVYGEVVEPGIVRVGDRVTVSEP